MKYSHKFLTTLILTLSSASLFAQTTLIKNVQGYTLNGETLQAFSAITFTEDKIDQLFTKQDKIDSQPDWHIIDGNGATMLPGLIDAHGHVLNYGQSLMTADLVGTRSEQAAVQRTLKYAHENPTLTWITGRGWNQVQWDVKTFPTKETLDVVFPDKPVWLRRVDGHAGWANSKAMALAGITQQSISPEGGSIIRDNNGQPTGVFIDNAMALIEKNIAPLTITQQKNILLKAMHSLASLGLTSVHDAGIDSETLTAFQQLSAEGKMPIRINAMLYLPTNQWQQTLDKGTFHSADHMLNFNSVKIQADGALGSRGAAMIEDYSDHAGHKGLLLHDNQSLSHYINSAMQAGFQVNTHAIGDNANKIVLDLYQTAIKKNNSKVLRHRVEHAQILRLIDIPRFHDLGIIASMQATHATSDKNMAVDRIGEDRILGAYAWRKLLNAKTVIAAGSDFPVESANPFFGLHASVTRQDKQNLPKNGWYPEEKMTRVEALKTFTIDAAFAGHQEKIIGSLAPGKKADFILLTDNYFTSDESKLWQNQVLSTWVNGIQVYKK
ncbi:amidohydrolase [Thalassotalea castellviae]|uniref:Amidohydrolase family protein n=1 Tax=Thalassotalea castellviae TaxID=3075612 RepID=A0ABU3A5M9_9GAMM|nr:amidohydrolase family protein [Thalassotalea sp. W431]MDT0604847.1 amidohydrolase family protein [Thalassotalea sp. W431]